VLERTIATQTHGRYLVEPASVSGPSPILVGFHGYGEGAAEMLARLTPIDGVSRWHIVSIQGLSRFYNRRSNEVVASWMTRQDRELAIADNVAYAAAVIETVAHDWPSTGDVVFAGFSQGVAMAFRAAASSGRRVRGIIAAGGDVPPEIDVASLATIERALVCHGARDEWYTPDTFAADLARLRAADVATRPLDFDGGHEWSDAVRVASAAFLNELR